MGTSYLLHFNTPLKHAQHYTGYTSRDVEARMHEHLTGRGSCLCTAVVKEGIEIQVARLWQGVSYSFEKRIKRYKNARLLCPICSGTAAYRRLKKEEE